MMTKKITTPYFPTGLKFVSPLLFLIGLYLCFVSHPVWGVLLIILAIVIFTTNYVTEIDLTAKYYTDHLSVAGIAMNKEENTFNEVSHIVVTKGNYSQAVRTRVQSRQIDWSDYTATLLFDGDKSLDLLTRNDKKELLREMKPIAEFLNVGIEDCTTREPYWIDLSKY